MSVHCTYLLLQTLICTVGTYTVLHTWQVSARSCLDGRSKLKGREGGRPLLVFERRGTGGQDRGEKEWFFERCGPHILDTALSWGEEEGTLLKGEKLWTHKVSEGGGGGEVGVVGGTCTNSSSHHIPTDLASVSVWLSTDQEGEGPFESPKRPLWRVFSPFHSDNCEVVLEERAKLLAATLAEQWRQCMYCA